MNTVNRDKRITMTQISLHKLHTMLNKKSFIVTEGCVWLYWKAVRKYMPDLHIQTLVCTCHLSVFKELPMTCLNHRYLISVVNAPSWSQRPPLGLLPTLTAQGAGRSALTAAQTCGRSHSCSELLLNLESFYTLWQMDYSHASKYVVCCL